MASTQERDRRGRHNTAKKVLRQLQEAEFPEKLKLGTREHDRNTLVGSHFIVRVLTRGPSWCSRMEAQLEVASRTRVVTYSIGPDGKLRVPERMVATASKHLEKMRAARTAKEAQRDGERALIQRAIAAIGNAREGVSPRFDRGQKEFFPQLKLTVARREIKLYPVLKEAKIHVQVSMDVDPSRAGQLPRLFRAVLHLDPKAEIE